MANHEAQKRCNKKLNDRELSSLARYSVKKNITVSKERQTELIRQLFVKKVLTCGRRRVQATTTQSPANQQS